MERSSLTSIASNPKLRSAIGGLVLFSLGGIANRAASRLFDAAADKTAELAGAVVTKNQLDDAVDLINGSTAQQIEALRTDLKILRTDIDRANQNCGLLTARVTGLHVALYRSVDTKRWKALQKSMDDAKSMSGDKAISLGPLDGQDSALKFFDVPRWR